MTTSRGYYKYKLSNIVDGETRQILFYINGVLAKTCTVIGRAFCSDYKILKYIDNNGQYRFYPFNDKWRQSDNPVEIGDKTNFVTSLLDGQGSTKQMGYKNTRTLSLTAYSVSDNELDKLSSIYTSPVCYLYVGDGVSDLKKDWILVKVKGDNIGRRPKANFGNVSITIELPEYYAITEI